MYGVAYQTYAPANLTGKRYTAAADGSIAADDRDVAALVLQGCSVLSGSGANSGVFAIDPFTTGTSHTVIFSTSLLITKATSTTVGAKTLSIPGAAPTNASYEWILKTTIGDGTVYTITPGSGTIDGAASYTFADNAKDAVWFMSDGISDWMTV
jgi:phage baseplate assembly protein gpV